VSAASQTKIFGIKIGVDPKIFVGALFAIALLLFFVYGRSDSGSASVGPSPAGASSAASTTTNALSSAAANSAARQLRRRNRTAVASLDRGALRIRPVDATRGDIDPTLRMDMLQRLRNVPEPAVGRSLFEVGETAPSLEAIQKVNQKLVPAAILPTTSVAPVVVVPHAEIPLKFYGFVKAARKSAINRGLFLDGDNVVIASEGDVIDGRYLVVTLTAQEARMEDTVVKQGQTLPVLPAAVQQ
jgi:hypothetical protein